MGSPAPASRSPELDEFAAIAARIEGGADHVTALELAAWIRERRPRLRVIDLRSPAEFAAGHLPTSVNRSLADLLSAGIEPAETTVLYSGGGTHAAQAWTLLAVAGAQNVFTLQGGFDAWVLEVLSPSRARTATAEEVAAFARVAELSRYFGGRPRIVDTVTPGEPAQHDARASSPGPEPSASELAARARRRGC